MKTLTPKPKSSLLTRVKRPLITSVAVIGSMSACVPAEEPLVREMSQAGEVPGEVPPDVGLSTLAGDRYQGVGEPPFAGEDFIGEAPQAGDHQMVIEPGDMNEPIDDPSEQDQSIAGSEPSDMMAVDLSVRDFEMIDRVDMSNDYMSNDDMSNDDMSNDELDAELNIGLPPERDSGIDEPGREEP